MLPSYACRQEDVVRARLGTTGGLLWSCELVYRHTSMLGQVQSAADLISKAAGSRIDCKDA